MLLQTRVDLRDEETKLIVESMEPYKLPQNAVKRQSARRKPKHMQIEISLDRQEKEALQFVERVLALLNENRGDVPYTLCAAGSTRTRGDRFSEYRNVVLSATGTTSRRPWWDANTYPSNGPDLTMRRYRR